MSSRRVVLGRALLATAATFGAPCASIAQGPLLVPAEPPTKIESLMIRQGTLVIQGSSRVGSVRAAAGDLITIASLELTDVQTGERALGIAVELRATEGRDPLRISYLDLEELPPLLAVLGYMARVQRTETTLDRFDARYRTAGGLLVTVFDAGGGMRAAVASGVAANAATELAFGELERLRLLLQQAREVLVALPGR